MNTSYKCNCCAKESVCKYSEEYTLVGDLIHNTTVGITTVVRFFCWFFSPVAPPVREPTR